MNSSATIDRLKRPVVIGIIAALLIAAIITIARSHPALAMTESSSFITTYTIPTANSKPTNIITLGPGQVWYTMYEAGAIGKLVVSGGGQATFTKFNTPTANSGPWDLAYDGTYIWFTERLGNKIGRLNPANGAITEYAIPTANSEPMGIAIAPNGHVWFAQKAGNKMARYKPATGTFDEYVYTQAGAMPEDVATSSNESIWFTAPGINSVIRLLPNKAPSQRFEQVPVLDFGQAPWIPGRIAVVDSFPEDNPWITAPTKDFIGRYAPGTLNYWRWYELDHSGTGVNGIFLQRMGNNYRTWFTEPATGRAGLLITSKDKAVVLAQFETGLPGTNTQPAGITVDSNGTAWITAPGVNAIMAWRSPYFHRGYMPVSVSR